MTGQIDPARAPEGFCCMGQGASRLCDYGSYDVSPFLVETRERNFPHRIFVCANCNEVKVHPWCQIDSVVPKKGVPDENLESSHRHAKVN
jgi:hypothetical protein